MDQGPDWQRLASSPTWGAEVVAALRQHFVEGRPLMERAVLIEAWAEHDDDGIAVLRAVYDHPFHPRRIGLRRRLDRPSVISEPLLEPAEELAYGIAYMEIGEPLGRLGDLLFPDSDGVAWWGYGYRSLSEHPDFGGDMDGWLQAQLRKHQRPGSSG